MTRCPRCITGRVVVGLDELYCLMCGWRPTREPPRAELVQPLSREEKVSLVEEFGPPREGLFEETQGQTYRLKWMLRDKARGYQDRLLRAALRRKVFVYPRHCPTGVYLN